MTRDLPLLMFNMKDSFSILELSGRFPSNNVHDYFEVVAVIATVLVYIPQNK